jgi:hypothetical protein
MSVVTLLDAGRTTDGNPLRLYRVVIDRVVLHVLEGYHGDEVLNLALAQYGVIDSEVFRAPSLQITTTAYRQIEPDAIRTTNRLLMAAS